MAAPNLDAQAPRGDTKESVNYRHHESCKTCAYYNGRVFCMKVEGHVSPDGVCNLWTMNESPAGMTGKEIIEKEYKKSKEG